MIKRDLFVAPSLTDVVLTSVCCSVFTDYTKGRANGMAFEWSSRTRIRIIGVNFSEFLIKLEK